jgi:hypothetical protein
MSEPNHHKRDTMTRRDTTDYKRRPWGVTPQSPIADRALRLFFQRALVGFRRWGWS